MAGDDGVGVGYRPAVHSGWFVRCLAPAALVVAYALVIPLKRQGLLPPTVTWVGVALVPALFFLSACAVLVFPLDTPRQRRAMLTTSMGALVAGIGAVYWQGWV